MVSAVLKRKFFTRQCKLLNITSRNGANGSVFFWKNIRSIEAVFPSPVSFWPVYSGVQRYFSGISIWNGIGKDSINKGRQAVVLIKKAIYELLY